MGGGGGHELHVRAGATITLHPRAAEARPTAVASSPSSPAAHPAAPASELGGGEADTPSGTAAAAAAAARGGGNADAVKVGDCLEVMDLPSPEL